jgi:hypothetical protein
MESKLSIWTRDVLNGLQGGPSVVRFACMGGLLVGIEYLTRQKAAREAVHATDPNGKVEVDEVVAVRRRTRGKVEEEVIVALAEVMEEYPLPLGDPFVNDDGPRSDWESEFSQSVSGSGGSKPTLHSLKHAPSNIQFRQGLIATLIFVLSSQILPLVAEDRLRALPLEVCLTCCSSVISIDHGFRYSSSRYWVPFPLRSRVENYYRAFRITLVPLG